VALELVRPGKRRGKGVFMAQEVLAVLVARHLCANVLCDDEPPPGV